MTRRALSRLLLVTGASLVLGHAVRRLFAHPSTQDQAPNRREFTLVASNYSFSPNRLEVTRDDLVKITLQGEDQAHSFAIDEYRVVRRVPASGTATVEFRADRSGTFAFYCNISSDPGCRQMRGELVVRPK